MLVESESKLGLQTLYYGKDDHEPLVDIVAVHGIGADPDKTWTSNGINWLKDSDMLPHSIPETRIMRFGYESQWLGHEAIQQRLPLVADQLLRSLMGLRTACSKRPLVFIGHCFGGIVIEKALLSAKLHMEDYPDIIRSTAGVVFLGTPHRGSASQSKASVIATIAAAVGIGEQSQLIGSVEKDSEMLADLVHDFTRAANAASIPLFCFFEQHKSDIAKMLRPKGTIAWPSYKALIVDEHSGTLDGYPKLGLACDHIRLTRFVGLNDSNYCYVRDTITQLVETAPVQVTKKLKRSSTYGYSANIREQQDQACLQAIFVTDPLDDMHTIESNKDRLMDRTGSWILNNTSFGTWRDRNTSALLWMHGDPGKGKTMVAISLIRELTTQLQLDSSKDRTTLTYFFCDNKDDRRKTASNVLRGLLYQILSQRPDLCFYLRSEYEKQKEHLLNSPNTLQTLWRILQNMKAYPNMEKLYVIIDAVDECEPESMDALLALLEPDISGKEHSNLGTETTSKYNTCLMKVLITSRNEISLEQNAVQVNESVKDFVDMKVKQLKKAKRYDDKLAALVRAELLEKAEGTFLWAALACRELAKPNVRLMQTKTVLQKLPSGLMPLYDRILEQILNVDDQEMAQYASAILRAMVVALRPFNLHELAIVADLPKEYLDEIEILEDYVSLCGSILEIREGFVYFIHLSARDYILSSSGVMSSNMSLDHEVVATRCFRHLCDFEPVDHGDSLDLTKAKCSRYDRLDYPVTFWLDHVRLAPPSISDELQSNSAFFRRDSRARGEWFNAYWNRKHAKWEEQPSNFTALHLAAYANLAGLISVLLSHEVETSIDVVDSQRNTSLLWAAKMGSNAAATVLILQGANIAAKNQDGLTALYLAAAYGHADVVQTLTQRAADVRVADRLGWTPLHRAADRGYTDIVVNLLQNGADIEAKDGGTWTVMYRAVSSGQLAVVKVLMEWKANSEVPDREGMTLLQTAAWNGHEQVVSLLLEYKAKVEARDREGWTALHHAAWNGHATVVSILLKNGAEVDGRNLEGNTPLYHAAWNGHTNVAHLLLRHGADVNGICTGGETALQQAAWRGHHSIVQLLLETGALPDARSDLGSTALHQAASNGQQDIAKLLLDSGADALAETEDGQTAFGAAKENSYYELARYLERRGGHPAENDEESEKGGMGLRRTDLEVDPAITSLLGLETGIARMQDHGDACSSEPMKVFAVVDGQTKIFFVKLGPIGDMFKGEHASLEALRTVVPSFCPATFGHGKQTDSTNHFLLTEFLDVNDHTSEAGSGLSFAQKLARLHSAAAPVPEGHSQAMFGFPVTTYAGRTRQDNTFRRSWAKFYAENRLRKISKLIEAAHGTDDELSLWIEKTAAELVPKLLGNGHLGGKRGIMPALVHGDLWSGNKARGRLGGEGGIEDIAFDASCCYAHSEYELGLMRMFGGFSAGFFSEYHRLIPKTEPQNEYEDRMKMYQIYHWLNNWLLFRGGYRDDAMDCMQDLYAKYGEETEDSEGNQH